MMHFIALNGKHSVKLPAQLNVSVIIFALLLLSIVLLTLQNPEFICIESSCNIVSDVVYTLP